MSSTERIIPSIAGIAGLALGACVVVTPLFAGGATPLGTMVVRLSALVLFLFWLVGDRPGNGLAALSKPLAVLVLLALFGVLQSMPWPRELARVLSPSHVALADGSALALGQPPASWVALSLYPTASRRVALDCLVFAALGIAAHRVGHRSSRRLWLAFAVVAAAGLQVLLGLRPWLGGLVPRLRGSYANPDHLCLLLEMAACVACGAVFWAFSTRRFQGETTLRTVGVLVSGAILLCLLSAIAFTGSRSGILAILVGLAVQVSAASRHRRWLALASAGAAGLAVAGFLVWLGHARSFGRLAATSWFEVVWGARAQVWLESLELIREFPLLGTGLGTFEQAFPLVQPVTTEGVRWAKAHNDFLEWWLTGGLAAAAIVAVGAAFLAMALISRLRSAVRTADRATLSAVLGCMTAVAIHEAFDFGLSLPANTFVLTAVVAASMACRTES